MNVNVSDPANAFTVWAIRPPGPIFCCGRADLSAATEDARRHVQLKNLVILSADPKHADFGFSASAWDRAGASWWRTSYECQHCSNNRNGFIRLWRGKWRVHALITAFLG